MQKERAIFTSKIFHAGENFAVGAKHNAEVTHIRHNTFYRCSKKFKSEIASAASQPRNDEYEKFYFVSLPIHPRYSLLPARIGMAIISGTM